MQMVDKQPKRKQPLNFNYLIKHPNSVILKMKDYTQGAQKITGMGNHDKRLWRLYHL